jgi:hypothetical protein
MVKVIREETERERHRHIEHTHTHTHTHTHGHGHTLTFFSLRNDGVLVLGLFNHLTANDNISRLETILAVVVNVLFFLYQ